MQIKGIGFIHREEFLPATIEKLGEELRKPYDPKMALQFLLNGGIRS